MLQILGGICASRIVSDNVDVAGREQRDMLVEVVPNGILTKPAPIQLSGS